MQSNGCCPSWSSASWPVPTAVICDVAIANQLDQRVALHVVVFDDQQRAQLAIVELANRVERLVERLAVRRLGPERLGAEPHAAMRIVGHRDDVHRDVARAGVVLQPIEHVPAVEAGQVEVERDRVGPMLPRHLQADVAAHRGEHAEVVLAARDPSGCARRRDRSR